MPQPQPNPTPPRAKPRILYLDALRAIAVIGVITIHVSAICWYDVTLPHWSAINLYDGLSRGAATGIFIMISGAVFLDAQRPLTIRKTWSKYTARILRMLLIWGFLYYALFQAPAQPTDTGYLLGFLSSFLNGGLYYHLWYLYMIAGLYIITPIIKRFTDHATGQDLIYSMLIAFACFALPTFLTDIWPDNLLAPFINKLRIGPGGGYLLYYLLGHYLHTYPPSRPWRYTLYAAGILATTATIRLTYTHSMASGRGIETFYAWLSPNVILSTAALFLLIKMLLTHITPPKTMQRLIKACSQCSLGIYLIHPIFVTLIANSTATGPLGRHPLLAIPLFTAAILIISFLAISLIRQIPYIGKKIT